MKVLTAAQMREADRHTIEDLGVPSLELMERAGRAVAESVSRQTSIEPVAVVCGPGNNGGDGWVVARLLAQAGRQVTVIETVLENECSPDCREMRRRALENPLIETAPADTELARFGLVVDAVYGTGFDADREDRSPSAVRSALRNLCETSGKTRIWAVDIPSGLDASTGRTGPECPAADVTVTFQFPKVGMFQGEGPSKVGALEVANIGIRHPGVLETAPDFVTDSDLRTLLKPWPKNAHKSTRGSILCVGGSTGMPGSVALAGYGALCAGAGLVTCAVPESVQPVVAGFFPELMTIPLPDSGTGCLTPEGAERILRLAERYDVIALGPGLTTQPPVREAVAILVRELGRPLVLDADGLNCLAEIGPIERKASITLTPHPGEMSRLLRKTPSEVLAERFAIALEAARCYQATVVLKGAFTLVCEPAGTCAVNSTGGPGLGTAGSGDVLTGAVAALTHRTASSFSGAVAAAYIHGLAGDTIARSSTSEAGFTAVDIARALPKALGTLLWR